MVETDIKWTFSLHILMLGIHPPAWSYTLSSFKLDADFLWYLLYIMRLVTLLTGLAVA